MEEQLEQLTDGLSPKQEEAIIALMNEPSIGKAARSIGIGERTLLRWLREPAFSKAYRLSRREAFSQAIAMTQRYAPLAVATLARIMADQNASTTAKVSAANAILRFGREGIELDDLAARIETLEAHAIANGGGRMLA
jgi:hypothetical protein